MKELKMFIDGKFVENESGKWIQVVNPSTEEVISLMPDGTVDDARKAIDAAEKAQAQWEKTPSNVRASYLTRIAAGIRKREKELTDIIVREGGKTQALANVEVLFTADYIDYMAGWARRYEGEIIPSDRPRESIFVFKKPIGVTTGILPWNFPFFLVARKAAPALITGNTIVVKPSQQTPENAYVFAQIVEEVGLPAGVFNLVNGRGSVIGHELAANPKVGMVSLTGSVSAGQQTMAAAAPNITKVSLELGGKAPAQLCRTGLRRQKNQTALYGETDCRYEAGKGGQSLRSGRFGHGAADRSECTGLYRAESGKRHPARRYLGVRRASYRYERLFLRADCA